MSVNALCNHHNSPPRGSESSDAGGLGISEEGLGLTDTESSIELLASVLSRLARRFVFPSAKRAAASTALSLASLMCVVVHARKTQTLVMAPVFMSATESCVKLSLSTYIDATIAPPNILNNSDAESRRTVVRIEANVDM